MSSPISTLARSSKRSTVLVLTLFALMGAGLTGFAAADGGSPVLSAPEALSTLQADFSGIKVGDRVKVTRVGGKGSLEGTVLELSDLSVKIKHKFGVQEIRKGDIASIEKFKTVAEQYEERAAKCKSPDDWCDLGDWAKGQNDSDLAEKAFREAIKLDTDFERARKALKEEKVDGEWLPFPEAQRRRGLELFEGDWKTPEEIAEIKKKRENKQSREKRKGREALALEYAGRPWGEIDPIETEHYIIHCNSTLEIAEYYADVMEALYEKYDSVFPPRVFPRNSTKKSEVWIHANHQQFMDWTFNGPGTGGFYMPATREVTAYHGSFGTTGSTEEVLAHEGTHQFQGLIFNNMWALPAWFIEGLAVYFGDGSKISRRKVEINEIPRDRLVGLKEAINNGTYCDIRTLLRIPQPSFGGFYYGHGWGVIYWCLWGEKMGAKNKGVGRPIMDDWLLKCREESKKEGWCDYPTMAKHFEDLIVQHSGKSLDEWEAEYKEWILSLPIEEIGKKRGNRWSSAPLKIEITKPVGWKWEKETELAGDEVVAAKGGGRQARRVSTYCWSNWNHADMNEEEASRRARSIFQNIDVGPEWTAEKIGGYDAFRASFKAKRVKRAETTRDENNNPTVNIETGEMLRYEIVFYGSYDKIFCNVFECDPELWDDNYKHFEKYLEDFKSDN